VDEHADSDLGIYRNGQTESHAMKTKILLLASIVVMAAPVLYFAGRDTMAAGTTDYQCRWESTEETVGPSSGLEAGTGGRKFYVEMERPKGSVFRVQRCVATRLVEDTPEPHGWTSDHCSHVQTFAPVEFIDFCSRRFPNVFPACMLSNGVVGGTSYDPRWDIQWPRTERTSPDPRSQMIQTGSSRGAYLEVHDCSWHSGENPRSKKDMRLVALR
jgi:hypothetical protein